MRQLRCIKLIRSNDGCASLTLGKIYELDKIGEDQFMSDGYVGSYSSLYLKCDDNQYRYFLKEAFIDIQQDREQKLNELGI